MIELHLEFIAWGNEEKSFLHKSFGFQRQKVKWWNRFLNCCKSQHFYPRGSQNRPEVTDWNISLSVDVEKRVLLLLTSYKMAYLSRSFWWAQVSVRAIDRPLVLRLLPCTCYAGTAMHPSQSASRSYRVGAFEVGHKLLRQVGKPLMFGRHLKLMVWAVKMMVFWLPGLLVKNLFRNCL